jgi:hypothetical protein
MNKSYGIYLDFLGDDLTRHSSRNIKSEDFWDAENEMTMWNSLEDFRT